MDDITTYLIACDGKTIIIGTEKGKVLFFTTKGGKQVYVSADIDEEDKQAFPSLAQKMFERFDRERKNNDDLVSIGGQMAKVDNRSLMAKLLAEKQSSLAEDLFGVPPYPPQGKDSVN